MRRLRSTQRRPKNDADSVQVCARRATHVTAAFEGGVFENTPPHIKTLGKFSQGRLREEWCELLYRRTHAKGMGFQISGRADAVCGW